ncbi:hypothetical protein [[Clostridium] polysaccharolyticum]|jgi:PHD/YefM family antitoxin component YafN of YafNO toxin-antitoxin module|uniref:Antitoxin n=1 Tax=[Clostridium] polysaccharolyticum TaxID=29364 RepID=A0A1I0FAH4_9FIRM|nr:hypothetical protein [[Clostridium] polysaccharolyticum]SET55033.1 hypothetical protein SAMN04487772_12919 [[Clostridium] polysaccharolyticum]
MPRILPMEQQKDFTKIMSLCKESKEPVFLTKDGAGALAVLDMESYEKFVNKEGKKETAEEEMDALDLLISLHKSLEESDVLMNFI